MPKRRLTLALAPADVPAAEAALLAMAGEPRPSRSKRARRRESGVTISSERTRFRLAPRQGSALAVMIERGEMRAGERCLPLNEIGLALEAGDAAVLWDVALRLADRVPCRIESRSQAERAAALAHAETAPAVQRWAAVRLKRKMTLDQALHRAGLAILDGVLRNAPAALARVPEGLHQMRVGVRRLRAVLALVKRLLPDAHRRWADGALKELGAALAPARDWDVFAYALIPPARDAAADAGALDHLAGAASRAREDAYAAGCAAILSQPFTAALLRLLRWFDMRGWRDQPVTKRSARLMAPLGKVAPALLARLHNKGLKRGRAFARLGAAERHRLRIALKEMRYASELLAPLYPTKAVQRFLRRLKPLQDDLGRANDLRSAGPLAAALGERAGNAVLAWHQRGRATAEAATRQHLRRYRRARPFW